MTDEAEGGRQPFEGASELKEAHSRLLEKFDRLLDRDPSRAGETTALLELEKEIHVFLDRGAATGLFLDDVKDRTACQVLLQYWQSSLAGAGRDVGHVRLATFDDARLPDLKDKPCPYVGLEPFQDQAFFFGREADTETLLEKTKEVDLVVVMGASGSGKSSLVMGGLLPKLEREKGTSGLRLARPFAPGDAVFDRLARCLLALFGDDEGSARELAFRLRKDPGHLAELLSDPGAPRVVITIDQFEEVFTLVEPGERDALVASLAQFLSSGRGHRLVLTVREEFRSRITGLRPLEPFLGKAWYSMRPMAYEELRAAVEKPAALVNLQFQSGIVDDLVKKVLGQPAALPLLQFTLRALWEHRDRNRITWEVYREVGDPLDALKTAADGFYFGLAPQSRDEVKRVLLELVRVDDLLEAYRQPVRKGHLLHAGKANTEEVLRVLTANDYLRITPGAAAADAVVEIKHEALIRNWPLLVGWIDDKRVERRQRLALSHAAERWAESGKPVEGLLTGWQIEGAQRYEGLSELEIEFVNASQRRLKQESRGREIRRLAVLACSFLLVIAVLVIAVLFQQQRAKKAQQASLSYLLVAKAERIRDHDVNGLEKSVLLSLEASRRAPSPEAESALRAGLALLPRHVVSVPSSGVSQKAAFSNDGSRVALLRQRDEGDRDRSVVVDLYEFGDDRDLRKLAALEERSTINAISFSSDETLVATASREDGVRVWRADTGTEVNHLAAGIEVQDLAFGGEGRLLATVEGGMAMVRELDTGRAICEIATDEPIFALAFPPAGDELATSGWDGVRVWDIRNGHEIQFLGVGEASIPSRNLVFSFDGDHLATVGLLDDATRIWDWNDPRAIASVAADTESVIFSPPGHYVATVSKSRSARVWEADSGKEVYRIPHDADVLAMTFRPDESRLVTATADGVLHVWDLRRGVGAGRFQHDDVITDVAYAPDGNRVATASWDSTAKIWDAATTEPLAVLPHEAEVNAVAFSVDGELIATASRDGAFVWQSDGNLITPLAQSSSVVDVAFSSDGSHLATGSLNGEIVVWTKEGRLVASEAHERLTDLAFRPGSDSLASAGEDGTVELWDWKTENAPIKTLTFDEPVRGLAFSPDGRYLATGEADSTRLWDLENLDETKPFWTAPQGASRRGVVYSPEYLIVAGDVASWAWKTSSGRPVEELPLAYLPERIGSLAVNAGAPFLLAATEDVAQLWFLDLEDVQKEACRRLKQNLSRADWERYLVGEDYRKTCPDLPVPGDEDSEQVP